MIRIYGRPLEYVVDFTQNLASIFVCILSVLIFVMKCKPTETQTKYYSFLLKHFLKMSKLLLLQNCSLKTQSVTLLIILIQNQIQNLDQIDLNRSRFHNGGDMHRLMLTGQCVQSVKTVQTVESTLCVQCVQSVQSVHSVHSVHSVQSV